jgi:hypothetical protein
MLSIAELDPFTVNQLIPRYKTKEVILKIHHVVHNQNNHVTTVPAGAEKLHKVGLMTGA